MSQGPRKNILVVIVGLSGSGKSTVSREFCNSYEGWTFIEGDRFFKRQKPKVKLSSGEIVNNWDHIESIDWDKLNQAVATSLHRSNTMLATFIPSTDRINKPIDICIKLNMGKNEIERCISARRVSKRLTTEGKIINDELMVREVVYPFHQSLPKLPLQQDICVYNGETRYPIDYLVDRIHNIISECIMKYTINS